MNFGHSLKIRNVNKQLIAIVNLISLNNLHDFSGHWHLNQLFLEPQKLDE